LNTKACRLKLVLEIWLSSHTHTHTHYACSTTYNQPFSNYTDLSITYIFNNELSVKIRSVAIRLICESF